MNDETAAIQEPTRARRGRLSLAVLLGLVLTVTVQLVTGFALVANPGKDLLIAHIAGGFCAIALLAAEWAWLIGTRLGREQLRQFFGASSGITEWTEAAFLAVVTATVVLGAMLASAMHDGLQLPFSKVLAVHRGLAVAVAVLYLLHSYLAARRSRQEQFGR